MKKFFYDYGMIFVLLALCVIFSLTTVEEQKASSPAAARALARGIENQQVLIATLDSESERTFSKILRETLELKGNQVTEMAGSPRDFIQVLEAMKADGKAPDIIAGPNAVDGWPAPAILVGKGLEAAAKAKRLTPASSRWPIFLTLSNLKNVANQIVVIAILAIGMTMVIITGGIDLSVGSLIALSATVAAAIILAVGGDAGPAEVGAGSVFFACLAGVGLCCFFGIFSGVMTACFGLPSFIVTLAVMMIARGHAYKAVGGEAKGSMPEAFQWLGQTKLAGLPVSIVMMIVLYTVAWFVMTKTAFGRYIYAIGGNVEAARLSGVPIRRVVIAVFGICGLLSGFGGIILASELSSGDPNTGTFYELYVIAAVVVGGTSLMGGQGKILGTLIGAFIIGVIRNGMNLNGIDPFNQMIVFGWIILLAVLLEKGKELLVLRQKA